MSLDILVLQVNVHMDFSVFLVFLFWQAIFGSNCSFLYEAIILARYSKLQKYQQVHI